MFLLSRLLSSTTIIIKNGQARCVKGKMIQQTVQSVSAVCGVFSITKGEIWVSRDGRIHFSSSIPQAAHQRLRNCVAQSPYN